MEKIERYVEEVCRRLGGPREMRLHVRQELREHLLDAVESLRAGGMSEQEAVKKALEDFGATAEVRGALEEAHGQRLTAVIVEKAMQWKEKTMKARWLWMTVAQIAIVTVILLEVAFVYGLLIFVLPKFHDMVIKGWLVAPDQATANLISWSSSYLGRLAGWLSHPCWLFLAIAAVWTLFEWRVQSENKAWMRLFSMGLGAVILFVVAAAAMILPLMVAWPRR
jgi:hypothetical protein